MEKESFFEKRFIAAVNSLYDLISTAKLLRALAATKRSNVRIKTQAVLFFALNKRIQTEIYALEEKSIGSNKERMFTLVLRRFDTKQELGYIPHVRCSTAFEPGTIADALDILVTFIFNKTEAIPKTKAKIKELKQKLKEKDQENITELEFELCYLQCRLTNMEEIDMLISEGYSVDRDFLDLTSF